MHGVGTSQVQDFAFAFLELHKVPISPQPIEFPLNSSPDLQLIDNSTRLGIDCKLTASTDMLTTVVLTGMR